jgi:ABC-type multidrug transport system fused ATPase/permease subunit
MSGRGDLRRTMTLFRRYASGQRKSFIVAGLLLAAEAATAVYQPTLLGALINFLKDGKPWKILTYTPVGNATIPALAVAIVAATALNSLSDSLAEISLAKAGRTVGYNLRVGLFGHLQKLSLAFHLRRRTGDVLTRITGDVQALEDFIVNSVSDLAGSFLLLAGTLAWLFYKSAQVALLAIIIVPILAAVSNVFARRIKAASKQLRAREGDLASTAQEMLSSISVVQIYGRSDFEERKFAQQSRSTMDAVMRTARLEAAFSFTVSVLEAMVVAAVVWIGALLIKPSISPGLLVTFILQIQNMFKPTRRIIKEWNTVGKIYASVERISELFDREPAVRDAVDAIKAPALRGQIEFRDVSFAYQSGSDELGESAPSRLSLDSVSFSVAAGEVVALVGHSGAGKSTIAQLVPRLYEPHAGAVLLDGYDIRQFTLESLRKQISMVLQETVLFRGTVAENIAYGRETATLDDVIVAAKQANAHDFIMAMPNGYDTSLGERAATLSGGQRQRLAIARGFIRDAPILILDEPTTGLDAESADQVRQALRTLVNGRSALIVSHDFNLIRGVDRILALSAGQILEEGTPEDLLARGGLYADLYARQFGEVVTDRAAELAASAPQAVDAHEAEETASTRREFETVLLRAVPLPASPEAFRLLTGRGPAIGSRPLEDTELEPLQAPALNRALPGLVEALDAGAMAPRLRGLISDEWDLQWCTPGKALVQPGEGATMRYRLGLRHLGSGRTVEHVVAGRLFTAAELAEDWLLECVAPLADRAAGRADLGAFRHLSQLDRSLRLVLHSFPVDPDLPGLLDATNPNRLPEILGPALADAVEGLILQECRPQVVRYVRPGRCVIRYEVLWRLPGSDRVLKQVVYGKVYADDRGAKIGPAITALRGRVQSASSPAARFMVPSSRGYLPDLKLALVDALPGSPQLTGLLRDWVAGVNPAAARQLGFERALASCARIVAALHESGIELGLTRSLQDEIEAAQSDVTAIAPLAPALAAALTAQLQGVADVSADTVPTRAFAHGDLTPGQFLFDGPLVGLVDFDSAGISEPASDLGQFVGYLDVATCKALSVRGRVEGGLATAGRIFLDDYIRATGTDVDAQSGSRVAAYRTLTLVRIAAQSWRQLKPARVQVARSLLDSDYAAGLGAR